MWAKIGGLVGLIAIVTLILALLSHRRDIHEAQQNQSYQSTQIAIMQAQLDVQQTMVAMAVQSLGSNAEFQALQGTATALAFQAETLVPSWSMGKLIIEEDFENPATNQFRTISGDFDVWSDLSGDRVLRTVNQSGSVRQLPRALSRYVVEVNIMQASDQKGIGGIHFGDGPNICPGYQVYMNPDANLIRLVEKNSSCDELATTVEANYNQSLPKNTWAKLRLEVRDTEVRVYLDGNRIIQRTNIDSGLLEIRYVGLWACCQNLLPYTFYFDDLRVWPIN